MARRLAWKAEGRRRVSPAVGVAVTGVALSVVVMLLSVAVVMGFKHEVTARVFAINDAVSITAYAPDGSPRTFDPAEVVSAVTLPAGATVVNHNSVEGILKTPDDFQGVSFQSRADIPADSLIALSASVASKLGLSVGDKIPAYFVLNERIRARSLRVGEIYNSGIADHDDIVVYCSEGLPRSLLGIPEGQVQSLGIRNVSAEAINPLAEEVHSSLLAAYYSGNLSGAFGVATVYQTEPSFFSWLDLLDTNVVVLLVLMGSVAAFTLISSLFIIILERVRTIGLLKALGATNGQIRTVFMLMAERLVLRGLLIGNAVGLGLIAVQHFTHAIPLDPASYFVEFVPVEFSLAGILILNAAALLLSWLVLLLPAMIVARISPSATMRYE